MNQDQLYRRGMGMGYDQNALEREVANGLRGEHPDDQGYGTQYDTTSYGRPVEISGLSGSYLMSDTFIAPSSPDKLLRSYETLPITPETLVLAEDNISVIISLLDEKQEAHLPITTLDISYDDVQASLKVLEIREQLLHEREEQDPIMLRHTNSWIETASRSDQTRDEVETLIAKIDAAEALLIEVSSDNEEQALVDVVTDVKSELVAALSAKQIAKYYALAA